MFTKKHFEACANAVRQLANENERSHLANLFAATFAESNPAFDRGRFIAACDATDYVAALAQAAAPFAVDEIGRMEGSRVVITGKAFRLLSVGQAFRHAAASPMVWVKTGSRTFRQRVDGYAHGPTHTVSNMAMLVVLEP